MAGTRVNCSLPGSPLKWTMVNYQHIYQYDSIEALNHAPHGWDADVSPIGVGSEQVRLCTSIGDQVMLNSVDMNCATLQRGNTPQGMRTFSLLLHREGSQSFRGHDIQSGSLIIFPEDRELHAVSSGATSLLNISITLEALRRSAHELELQPGALAKFPVVAPLCRTRLSQLLAKVESLSANLASKDSHDQMASPSIKLQEEELVDSLLQAIVSASGSGQKVAPDKRYRATRLALDYIQNHPREATSISALANEVGASRRTLETAFRDLLDMPPKQYINTSRLRGCRKELLSQRGNPCTNVSKVAHSWGFSHQGQFSSDYRKLFDERPSDTLSGTR